MTTAQVSVRLVEAQIARVALHPGDKLVVLCERPLSEEELRAVFSAIQDWAPGIPTLILDGGYQLAVVSGEPEDMEDV